MARQVISEGANLESYNRRGAADAYDGEALRWSEEYIFTSYFATPGRVLDLGCGTGRTSRQLARRGHQVAAIDYSRTMLARARERSKGYSLGLLLMDAVALGFQGASFDYCLFSANGLDYVYPRASRIRALREVYRVLKPGGVFAFSSHNSLWFPTKPRAMLDFLKSAACLKLAPYRWDYAWFGRLIVHVISPKGQVRELQDAGFTAVEIVSRYSRDVRMITLLDPFPSYVCARPREQPEPMSARPISATST